MLILTQALRNVAQRQLIASLGMTLGEAENFSKSEESRPMNFVDVTL